MVWQSGKEVGLEFEQPDIARDERHVASEHPERRNNTTLSGQTLALRAALDEIQSGVLLLDHDRAQFINRAFRKMWNVPDALAASKPAFVALLYYCRDNNVYQAEPAEVHAVFALATEARLKLLRELSIESERTRIGREAHSLKSSAGTFGYRALAGLALRLERDAVRLAEVEYLALLDSIDAAHASAAALELEG